MGYKAIIKKLAKWILVQPERHLTLSTATLSMGGALIGKNAVITGGSKGIGKAIARKLVSEGASVIITGRNEKDLITASNEIGTKYLVWDSSDSSMSDSFIKKCAELLGHVDILILNAGVSFHEGNIMNVTEDGFDKQFDTNFKGVYFTAQKFLHYATESNIQANLLLTSSETSAACCDIPYGITKAAINSLVGALSRRFYQSGIRVNAIAPGVTLTNMTSSYTNIEGGNLANTSGAGRVFLPEEIAEVASFLVSEVSTCISGEVLFCDCGNHLKVNF